MKRRMFFNHLNNMRSRTAKYPKTSEERYSIVSRRGKIPTQMEVCDHTAKAYDEEE